MPWKCKEPGHKQLYGIDLISLEYSGLSTRKKYCVAVSLTKNFGAETRIFQKNQVNITAADALAPCIARLSTAMVFSVYVYWILVLHEERFQLLKPSQCWEMTETKNIF